MYEREKLIGDILVAIVKIAGGKIDLSVANLQKEPNEIVYIQNNPDGTVSLTVQDRTIIEV